MMSQTKRLWIVLLLVSVLSFACDHPSDDEVKNQFLREHPTYKVISVGVGEGDGSAAYYHIRYMKPNDAKKYEVVWGYLNKEGSKWVLFSKEAEKLVE